MPPAAAAPATLTPEQIGLPVLAAPVTAIPSVFSIAADAVLPPLDPVPLAEAASMVPRAREKLLTSPSLPGVLRPLFRNQGGFNGILLGASSRLVEAGQQLARENERLRERVEVLSRHLAEQSAWIESQTHARVRECEWMAAVASCLARAQAEADFQRQRADRMEVRLDHLEAFRAEQTAVSARQSATFAEQATALAELEQQRDQDQLWLQSLQAGANAQEKHPATLSEHLGHTKEQLQELRQLIGGHAEHLRSLQQGHGEHVGHLQIVDTRLDLLGDHLGALQKQSDEQGDYARTVHGHMDRLGEHVDTLFHEAHPLADQLTGLQTHVEHLSGHLNGLQTYADQMGQHLRGLQEQTDTQGRHLQGLQTQSNGQSEHLTALQAHADRQNDHLDTLQSRVDASNDLFTQGREELRQATSRQTLLEDNARRLEERQVTDASYLKGQLSFHQRLLEQRFTGSRDDGSQPLLALPYSGGDASFSSPAQAEAPDEHQFDALYLAFESIFRGSREVIKERVSFFIPYLEAARVGSVASPVLDLGCGRGEWLELLRERGFAASGVDLNRAMIEQCRERGLTATFANALDYLAAQPDASCGAITAFHLIEHLPFRALVRFLEECRRVLQPGGVAIFETPNPDNILVGASTFYSDFTHQRPLPPNSTKFLVEQVGFAEVTIVPLHPYEDDAKVPGEGESALRDRFNALFYGPQDYALVAVTAPSSHAHPHRDHPGAFHSGRSGGSRP